MAFSSRHQKKSEPPVRHPKFLQKDQVDVLFQRSRTLTGSVSSAVSSATEAASILRSPRLREHDLRGHRKKLLTLLTACLLIASFIVWCLYQYIVYIRVDESSALSRQYIAQVDEYLSSHPMQRLQVFLDTDALARDMQKKSPEIETVNIRNTGFLMDTLDIQLREAVASWKLGDKIYYVDKNGVAFEKKPAKEPSLTIQDESGLPVASQRLASANMLYFIGQVVGELSSRIGKVESVIIPAGTLKQVDVVLAGKPTRIQLHTDREPVGQAIDAENAFRHIEKKGIQPEYLDVRIEGKAFYKP